MKKITLLLLILITVLSSLTFTGCQSQCKKSGHDFYPADTCRICKKSKCELGFHNWNGTRCSRCYATKCEVSNHTFMGLEYCEYCNVRCCDIGEHNYITHNSEKICKWCEKEKCDLEGHDYRKGICSVCEDKKFGYAVTSFFEDLFEGDKSPEKPNEEVKEDGKDDKFREVVSEALMIFGSMLIIAVICSLIFWLGAFLNSNFIVWFAHMIMLIVTVGSFLAFHWAWGLIFFLLFDSIYICLIGRLLSEEYGFHGTNWW